MNVNANLICTVSRLDCIKSKNLVNVYMLKKPVNYRIV